MTNKFRRRRYEKVRFENVNATATRAVVSTVHGDIEKIALTFTMDRSKEEITFELTVREAGKFIEQVMSSYNAIMPPLRTSRGGLGL